MKPIDLSQLDRVSGENHSGLSSAPLVICRNDNLSVENRVGCVDGSNSPTSWWSTAGIIVARMQCPREIPLVASGGISGVASCKCEYVNSFAGSSTAALLFHGLIIY